MSKTLYDKLWENHVVHQEADGTALLYIDRHLIHEVTSPQAFEGLKLAGRKPWRVSSIVSTPDHNTPTDHWEEGIKDPISRQQVETLDANIREVGALAYFPFKDPRMGILHVVGPENGATLPGMTVVCGDSHTSTHGAFACLAHGIGTSEVEHVLATQCLVQKKSKTMLVAIEFGGSAIRGLSMEGRMTLCNMAIEGGARMGFVAVDDTTINYLKGRPFSPTGDNWDRAVAYWRTLHSDAGAQFDRIVTLKAEDIRPQVTWGTSPEMVVAIDAVVPDPAKQADPVKREGMERALQYMGLNPNTPISQIAVDKVFIGSCTNSRIEDLREAASVLKGRHVAANVKLALAVPGSGLVKRQAEAEGLDKVFVAAGFEWREPGCSMCLAMNADRLEPGERCASTSNRNFEGRQGAGGRTHLVSPAMAAAAAIHGHFVDIRQFA